MSLVEESVLSDRLHKRTLIEYYQTLVVVNAVIEGVKVSREGGSFDLTNKTLKRYQSLVFPGMVEDDAKTAEKTKALLEHEYNKGPLQIQALDYGSGRKRRRKR